jgi:hypothetical protein
MMIAAACPHLGVGPALPLSPLLLLLLLVPLSPPLN